jgi:hypothetical protein
MIRRPSAPSAPRSPPLVPLCRRDAEDVFSTFVARTEGDASMDDLLGRVQSLEQHVQHLQQQTVSVARRLRWWRLLACSLAVLTVFAMPLSLGAGPEDRRAGARRAGSAHQQKPKHDDDKISNGLAHRLRALEQKLEHVTSEIGDGGHRELVLTGANLRIVNGLGTTDTTNGLGNLIVGYNEIRGPFVQNPENVRTGSHVVVIGRGHNFSRFGGIVVGDTNAIAGDFSSVTGGTENVAGGRSSSVNGGEFSTASGDVSSISGGHFNSAPVFLGWVGGGQFNVAGGLGASASGGSNNRASGELASISGGADNLASGDGASISGGHANVASGGDSSVSGGGFNTASGGNASVSGGTQRTAAGMFDWVAGGLSQDQ